MPLAKALKEWELKHGAPASEAKDIALYGGMVLDGKRVFINKLDASLATLKECECVWGWGAWEVRAVLGARAAVLSARAQCTALAQCMAATCTSRVVTRDALRGRAFACTFIRPSPLNPSPQKALALD